MIILKDYNLKTIREFSLAQFAGHLELMKTISELNDFGAETKINESLQFFVSLMDVMYQQHIEKGIEEFILSREESLLYDLMGDLVRLCYKHSYRTDSENDWEQEF